MLSETMERKQLVGIAGLYVTYLKMYRDFADRKFMRAIFEMYKKVHRRLFVLLWFQTSLVCV